MSDKIIIENTQPESQKTNNSPVWGTGLKQTNGLFATLVNSPAGVINAKQLEKITELTTKGAGLAKLTHAQRIILLLKPEQLDTVQAELAAVGLRIGVLHKGIRNIRGCCGALCKWAKGSDGLGLAIKIDEKLFGRKMKFDIKIAVSDCLRNCMETYCVDIGLLGKKGTYSLLVGGSASAEQIRGVKVASEITTEEAIPLIEKVLTWYDKNANEGERLFKLLERLGKEEAQSQYHALEATIKVFEPVSMGQNIKLMLQRKLARSYGARQMQQDLQLN